MFGVSLAVHPLTVRTRQEYRRDAQSLVAFLQSQCHVVRPSQVTSTLLETYVAALAQQGCVPATQRRQIAAIRSFFAFLHGHGYIATNPAWRLCPPERDAPRPGILDEHVCDLLERLASGVSRDAALVAVLVHTGVRVSEVTRLRVADLSLPAQGHADEGQARIAGTGHRARVVTLPAGTCAVLQRYLVDRPPTATDALFLSHRHQRLTIRGIRLIVRRYLDAAGVAWATLRTLRHSFAVHELQKGVTLRTLHQVLGHASPATVAPYLAIASPVDPSTPPTVRSSSLMQSDEDSSSPPTTARHRRSA